MLFIYRNLDNPPPGSSAEIPQKTPEKIKTPEPAKPLPEVEKNDILALYKTTIERIDKAKEMLFACARILNSEETGNESRKKMQNLYNEARKILDDIIKDLPQAQEINNASDIEKIVYRDIVEIEKNLFIETLIKNGINADKEVIEKVFRTQLYSQSPAKEVLNSVKKLQNENFTTTEALELIASYETPEKIKDKVWMESLNFDTLNSMNATVKKLYLKNIELWLKEAPLNEFRIYKKWLTRVKLLMQCGRKIPEEIIKNLENNTKEAIKIDKQEIEKYFTKDTGYEKANSHLQNIYYLMDDIGSSHFMPQCFEICKQAIHEIEKETTGDGEKEFINKKIEEVEKNEPSETKTDADELGEYLFDELIKSNPVVLRKSGNKVLYNQQSEKGPSQWGLSLFSRNSAVFRLTGNEDVLKNIPLQQIGNLIKNGNLDKVLQTAIDDQESLERKKDTIAKFDLPKDQPVSYLQIFPASFESNLGVEVIASSLHPALMVKNALKQKYGSKFNASPIIFSDDPKSSLVQEISAGYQKGTKNFCIDLFNHGSEDKIEFRTPFSAKDLAEIVRNFPDCNFTFGTIACFGGGLREGILEEIKKNPEIKNRINIFLQTKPDVVNRVATTTKNIKIEGIDRPFRKTEYYATNYSLYFTKALYEGKTFGEAHLYADTETKKNEPLDAEAIINGDLFSILQPATQDNKTA